MMWAISTILLDPPLKKTHQVSRMNENESVIEVATIST